jgi:hypothetical protein
MILIWQHVRQQVQAMSVSGKRVHGTAGVNRRAVGIFIHRMTATKPTMQALLYI